MHISQQMKKHEQIKSPFYLHQSAPDAMTLKETNKEITWSLKHKKSPSESPGLSHHIKSLLIKSELLQTFAADLDRFQRLHSIKSSILLNDVVLHSRSFLIGEDLSKIN